MPAEIGQFALILALMMTVVQTGASLWGGSRREAVAMAMGRMATLLQAGFVCLAFAALAFSYLTNDFSVALVAGHSNSAQPLIYRLGATWGSHEGSMLLWVLILALYGGAIATFGGNLRETLLARVLGVQGAIGATFISFLLFTSNPFLRLDPAPVEGIELNPLLQDPGLVFHPPMLYLGYVGFSVAFAFAIAALIEGRVDAAWARWVRPWVLAAWICLTIGITMGSLWSYYVLGWGGWWFWDPVENASLMPWLMGTALLHSSLVLERRGALISWTILLAILTFSLSLIGTFLVRSGVVTSVHAFAVDPKRGVFILGIIAVTVGSALSLFAWRAPAMRSGALFEPISREGGITLNNLLLLTLTATVFLGTFYPVFVEIAHGGAISVGPPYYQRTFLPLACPLLLLVTFGPTLNWRSDNPRQVVRKLRWPIGLCVITLIAAVAFAGVARTFQALGLTLGVWLVAGAMTLGVRRWRREAGIARSVAQMLRTTPMAIWGLILAHAGLGVTVIGISAVSGWQTSKVLLMSPGQTAVIAGSSVTMNKLQSVQGPNYVAAKAEFTVSGMLGTRTLSAERRFFPSSQTQTTQPGVNAQVLGNTFVAIGDQQPDGSVVVRLWNHPLVGWIWAGGLIMALGGMVSLADRRYRLGAAIRGVAIGPAALAPAP